MDGPHIAFIILLILWVGSMIIILILTTVLRRMVRGRDRTIEEQRHKIEYYKGYVERLETGMRSWTDRCHHRDKRLTDLIELAQKKF